MEMSKHVLNVFYELGLVCIVFEKAHTKRCTYCLNV